MIRPLTLALACVIAACSSEVVPGDLVTVVDSAGIRVVTSQAPLESYSAYSHVDAEPRLTIGTLTGAGPDAFGSVVDVHGLDDGSVLVADGQVEEIKHFDRLGAYLQTYGRRGEGPGEFSRLTSIIHADLDSLWAWDSRTQRVSVFSTEGSFERSFARGGEGRVGGLSMLAGRGLVGLPRPSVANLTIDLSQRFARARDDVRLVLYSYGGDPSDTLASFPGTEGIGSGPIAIAGGTVYRTYTPPFGRSYAYAAANDGLVGGPNDRFELNWWTPDGHLVAITRLPGLDRPVTADETAELRRNEIDGARGRNEVRRDMEELFDRFPPPPIRPAFSRILADDAGRIWVGEYHPIRRDPKRWWVFDPESRMPLGHVDTPEGLRVYQVQSESILGMRRDELDVAYVQRYALTKTGG